MDTRKSKKTKDIFKFTLAFIVASTDLLAFQVVDLQVFASPRITLKPLVPTFPCFAKILVSLMEKVRVTVDLFLVEFLYKWNTIVFNQDLRYFLSVYICSFPELQSYYLVKMTLLSRQNR